MKLIITSLLALVLLLTILNKVISLFRPQKKMESKWLVWGLMIAATLLFGSLAHFYINRSESPSGAGVVAAFILFAVFADQYRIQRSHKISK